MPCQLDETTFSIVSFLRLLTDVRYHSGQTHERFGNYLTPDALPNTTWAQTYNLKTAALTHQATAACMTPITNFQTLWLKCSVDVRQLVSSHQLSSAALCSTELLSAAVFAIMML